VVFRHFGTVDKFMGDGILIMFGAPLATDYHTTLAMEAALEILDLTQQLSQRWRETKNIDTEIGISLSSGPAFVGFLGPADKMEYTAIGDTVNLCVRLQEQTKQFNTRLIISEFTVQQLKLELYKMIDLGEVSVRGREAHVKVFTLEQAQLDNSGKS
jgi:adenylate cyclase